MQFLLARIILHCETVRRNSAQFFLFLFFFFARVTFPRRERNERNNLAGSIRDIDSFRSNKRFVRGEKKKEGEEGFLRVTFRSIRMEEKEEEKGSRKARDNGG